MYLYRAVDSTRVHRLACFGQARTVTANSSLFVSPLLFSRAKKEYESALSGDLRTKLTLVSAGDRVRDAQVVRDTNISKMHAAETTVWQTETQLSLTRIYAPANGHVVFDKTNFAHHLLAGEPFMKLVGDDPWVVANFNENQLKQIKLGQKVAIRIEGIKQRTFRGEVVNIAPVACGSAGPMAALFSQLAFIHGADGDVDAGC